MDTVQVAFKFAARASQDYHSKERWLALGKAILRQLAEDLNIAKDSFDIGSSPGGSGVAGDVSLRHDKIHIILVGDQVETFAGYARSVAHRRDYTGSQNLWFEASYVDLFRVTRNLLQSAGLVVPDAPPEVKIPTSQRVRAYAWNPLVIAGRRESWRPGDEAFRCVVGASSIKEAAAVVGLSTALIRGLSETTDAREVAQALKNPGVVWFRIGSSDFEMLDGPIGRF